MNTLTIEDILVIKKLLVKNREFDIASKVREYEKIIFPNKAQSAINDTGTHPIMLKEVSLEKYCDIDLKKMQAAILRSIPEGVPINLKKIRKKLKNI